MFAIKFLDYAKKKAGKLLKKNNLLKHKLDLCLINLKNNPFDPSLKTHKVRSKVFGVKYCSSLTGDLRLIWDFNELEDEITIIEIFDIGGHSGKNSVY